MLPRRSLLVLASGFWLLASNAPAQVSDCTFDSSRSAARPRERWHQITVNSEAVSRGRAVRRGTEGAILRRNFIDDEIFGTLEGAGIKPTTISTDQEFLRRVYLDLTGQIPDSNAVSAFLADSRADKRGRVIDQLAASDGFSDRWTLWFGDLVQNVQFSEFSREYPQGRNAFYKFIRDSIQAGKPYDQMVREVVAGTGENFTVGPPNYVVRQIQPNGPIQDTWDNLSAHTGERFLGMPLVCISCHDGLRHLESVNIYLSTRKRMDFWKNAAFFARTNLQLVREGNVRKYTIGDNPNGGYRLNTVSGNKTPRQPAPGQPNTLEPAFFLSGESPTTGEPWRQAYGRLLTANPQFARATVNYVWREMFGLALVEPPDSIDLNRLDPTKLAFGVTLQTLHPQLLERLTGWFRTSNYDLRGLVKLMAGSSAYQLSMTYAPGNWDESWTPYFARHYARRVSSEALLDSVFVATGIAADLPVNESTPVRKAMMLPDTIEPGNRNPYGRILNTFGRGDRDETRRTDESSITQSLILLNDPQVTVRVKQTTAGSTVQKTLNATKDPAQIAEALYVATLSRKPTAQESANAVEHLRSGEIGRKTEDLQYALINSLEFLFN